MAKANQSGYTWILLRGLGREKGHWGGFTEQFASAYPADEVLPIDLPGTGDHRFEQSPLQMSAIFRRVRAEAIRRARQQSQFKILAVSLGAMVAMEWLRQKSEDLAACVLINPSVRSLSPFYRRLRWQVWGEFGKLTTMQGARERERGILELLMNNPDARAKALPLWTKIAVERPVTYSNFFSQLSASATFNGLIKNSPVPTLLLNGLGDRLVDPSCSTGLHQHYGWPICRHPWAGHDTAWDDPQWVIDKVSEWSVTGS